MVRARSSVSQSALPAASPVLEALPLVAADDAALLRAIVQGHPGAARLVCARHATLVRSLLRRALGASGEIEDLVQDTFLHLFRRARDVRDPSALTSFVVGIAMRVARSELRRRRLRRWLLLTDTGTVPEPLAEDADPAARQALACLYRILDRLDDDSRLAFVLRRVEGLALEEVASALDCSLATAKRRIDKASRRIVALAGRESALSPYLSESEGRDG